MKKKKKTTIQKSKLYILRITKNGNVVDVLTSTNYDALMEEGMNIAHEVEGSWTIFNSRGREVDGSRL